MLDVAISKKVAQALRQGEARACKSEPSRSRFWTSWLGLGGRFDAAVLNAAFGPAAVLALGGAYLTDLVDALAGARAVLVKGAAGGQATDLAVGTSLAGAGGHAVLVDLARQDRTAAVLALLVDGAVLVGAAGTVRNAAKIGSAIVLGRAGRRAACQGLAASVGVAGAVFLAALGWRAVKVIAAGIQRNAIELFAAIVDPALSIGRTLGDLGRALATGTTLLIRWAITVILARQWRASSAVAKSKPDGEP